MASIFEEFERFTLFLHDWGYYAAPIGEKHELAGKIFGEWFSTYGDSNPFVNVLHTRHSKSYSLCSAVPDIIELADDIFDERGVSYAKA